MGNSPIKNYALAILGILFYLISQQKLYAQVILNQGRPAQSQRASNQATSPKANFDFRTYFTELALHLRRNWTPSPEDRMKRVIVIFHITRDGHLLSVKIRDSSGSPSADAAAISAVKLSAPFKAFPANYKTNDIPIMFAFDQQVLDGNDSSNLPNKSNRNNSHPQIEMSLDRYIYELKRRIHRNWSPALKYSDQSRHVTVTFIVSKDGQLLDVGISNSSGSPEFDEAAIQAVKLSAPFKALPTNYKRNSLQQKLSFDYQVFGSVSNTNRNHNNIEQPGSSNPSGTNFNFDSYNAELQRGISTNWAPSTEELNKHVVVIFHISRDGRLLSLHISSSSGSSSTDAAAIAAVKRSGPFRVLPQATKNMI